MRHIDITRIITLISLRKDEQLDFDAMDAFIASILEILQEQGGRVVRVFPPDAGVLISFSERLANEVVSLSILCARPLNSFKFA